MKSVVVIGGGHGLSTILSGIKEIKDINISAIVTVADDGGSTGRIRQRYSIPAMGDIRSVMLSMSKANPLLQELMKYRFEGEDNNDIAGHSLGNLILTALTDISGSFDDAIKEVSRILRLDGKVIPSTLESVSLLAEMEDGSIVKGEAKIPSLKKHVSKVFYDHEVKANDEAISAILNADLIIYGIGSLYTSILPNTIIPGIKEALDKTNAKRVYFANAMSQANETYNYDLKDHIDALELHGTKINYVVRHNSEIPQEIKDKYYKQDSIEVVYQREVKQKVIEKDLLDFSLGLVRHDANKIKEVVEELLK